LREREGERIENEGEDILRMYDIRSFRIKSIVGWLIDCLIDTISTCRLIDKKRNEMDSIDREQKNKNVIINTQQELFSKKERKREREIGNNINKHKPNQSIYNYINHNYKHNKRRKSFGPLEGL
jgi:hypothetical protein